MSSKVPVEVQVDEIIEDHSVTRSGDSSYVKRYKRGKYLGKGGFAKVYEMTSFDSSRTYAGKVISKASLTEANAKRKLGNEIKIHHSLSHPHIVKFERFFEDKVNVYILLEPCPNNTLMELVKRRKRLTESETQLYMWQLIRAVTYLHSQNIIHRDLKLGNLFLDCNFELKVGDFGLATKLKHAGERKRTICGTPNYIAPEILHGQNGHSFEVDVWSMGVIMYTLLIGKPPFETSSVKSTYKKICDNNYEFPDAAVISPAAKALIQRLLSARPEDRPTAESMRNDRFFTQCPFPARFPPTIASQPLTFPHVCYPATQASEEAIAQARALGVIAIPPADEHPAAPAAGAAMRAIPEEDSKEMEVGEVDEEEEVASAPGAITAAAAAAAAAAVAAVAESEPGSRAPGRKLRSSIKGKKKVEAQGEDQENIGAKAPHPITPKESDRRIVRPDARPAAGIRSSKSGEGGLRDRAHSEIAARDAKKQVMRVHMRLHPQEPAPSLAPRPSVPPSKGAGGGVAVAGQKPAEMDIEDDDEVGDPRMRGGKPAPTVLHIRSGHGRSKSDIAGIDPQDRKRQGARASELVRESGRVGGDVRGDVRGDGSRVSGGRIRSSSKPPLVVHPPGRGMSVAIKKLPSSSAVSAVSSGEGEEIEGEREDDGIVDEKRKTGRVRVIPYQGPRRSVRRLRSDSGPDEPDSQPGSQPSSQPSSQPGSQASSRASSRAASPGPNSTIFPGSESSSRSSSRPPSPGGHDSRPPSEPSSRPSSPPPTGLVGEVGGGGGGGGLLIHGTMAAVETPHSPAASATPAGDEFGGRREEEEKGDDLSLGLEDAERLQELSRAKIRKSAQDEVDEAALCEMLEELQRMREIAASGASTPRGDQGPPPDLFVEEACVTRWVDYSKKYGLGYTLSNLTAGVCFNDSSKIIVSENDRDVNYVEKPHQMGSPPVWKAYRIDDHPEEMKKKMLLLTHFVDYLKHQPGPKIPYRPRVPPPPRLHVSKWVRVRNAILFHLSSRVLQVMFVDNSQLMMTARVHSNGSGSGLKVYYVSYMSKESIISCPLLRAPRYPVLLRHLNYVYQVLVHFLSARMSPYGPPIAMSGPAPLGPYAAVPFGVHPASSAGAAAVAHGAHPAGGPHHHPSGVVAGGAAGGPPVAAPPPAVSGVTSYLTNLRLI